MRFTDDEFADHVADMLAGLPSVEAVALGGSRAAGTHRPDSDWDFALELAGLRGLDAIVPTMTPSPDALAAALDRLADALTVASQARYALGLLTSS